MLQLHGGRQTSCYHNTTNSKKKLMVTYSLLLHFFLFVIHSRWLQMESITKIYSLSCHNPSSSRCWAQGQIIVFSSLLESCQAYCIVNCIMIWLIFRDNHVLYHGKLYCCSLVTNGFFTGWPAGL